MFIENGFWTPTTWAIEFPNDIGFVFKFELINSVFITVEDEKTSRAATFRSFNGVEDVLGMQSLKLTRKRVVSEEREMTVMRRVLAVEG